MRRVAGAGFGADSAQIRRRFGADLAQIWRRFGADSAQIWLRFGADSAQIRRNGRMAQGLGIAVWGLGSRVERVLGRAQVSEIGV